MNCVIIDDHELAIKALRNLILHFCPQVIVLGHSQTIAEAIPLINDLKPDLVFLDVEMNNETGFDLLNYFPEPGFKIIFTTAHEKYALQAIKNQCFDYLLKPICVKELIRSVFNVKKAIALQKLQEGSEEVKVKPGKIAFNTPVGFSFIDEADVMYFKADGKYTHIITNTNKLYTSNKNIGEIEATISSCFFRSHKSFIINLNYVTSFNKNEGMVILANDARIEISVRKKDEFIQRFKKL